MAIIRQIKAGFPQGFRHFEIVPDRAQAIATALSAARTDDTVLLAGRGHEAYQTCDHISIPFLDREVVERWLGSRPACAPPRFASQREADGAGKHLVAVSP